MADQNAMMQVPPGEDPVDYAKLMRQQQIADALQQAALSPVQVQQPQGSNRGFYQAARVSPLSGLSRLAEAVMAKRATDTSNTNMAQMYARGLQAFNPNGPSPAPAPAAPGAEGGYTGGAGASDAGQPASAQPAAPNPLNPLHVDARALFRLYQTDPAKYLDAIKGTPEWQTALAANGGNVSATQAALRAKMAKEGAISNRSGEENMIPDPTAPGGYRFIRTPNLGPNQDFTRDANGGIAETHLIPGALAAEGALKGREVAETHANTPIEVDMGGGVKALRYPGDVKGVGLPPSLRGPQAPETPNLPSIGGGGAAPAPAPHRSYFPPIPSTAPPAPAATAGPVIPQKDPATGTFDNNLWPNIPKMAIPVTPGQTTNQYQEAIIGSAAKKHQELVDKFGEGSAQAVLSNNYLAQALKELPQAETGPLSEWLTENRGKLIEAVPGLAKLLPSSGTVTPTLELNKALVNSGLQGAKANFGRLTQSEVMLQKDEMSPSAKMTHDAIAALIHQQQIKNGYAIQQDKDYGEYHAQNGDPNRFESQYNVRRPISRFAAQYDTPAPAIERVRKNPQLLPDFRNKYGWDPTQ